MSHAPYHSAKILFYFCATNFFRSAFSSLATRKIDASSPPSVATAKGRNSILWTSFKNKPTFRKNTTTFLTFSTGLKQEIITRRNNIRPEVKFLSHSTSSRAHHAHIRCFPIFAFTPSPHPFNTLIHKTLRVKTSPSSAFTFLHPFSPLYPTPSVKVFRGETFTLIILQFKPLRHKGEEVKAKIEKQWMRAQCAREAKMPSPHRGLHAPLASTIARGKKTTVGNKVFHYRTGHKNAPISPHSGASCRRHYENKRKKFATSKIMRNFVA